MTCLYPMRKADTKTTMSLMHNQRRGVSTYTACLLTNSVILVFGRTCILPGFACGRLHDLGYTFSRDFIHFQGVATAGLCMARLVVVSWSTRLLFCALAVDSVTWTPGGAQSWAQHRAAATCIH